MLTESTIDRYVTAIMQKYPNLNPDEMSFRFVQDAVHEQVRLEIYSQYPTANSMIVETLVTSSQILYEELLSSVGLDIDDIYQNIELDPAQSELVTFANDLFRIVSAKTLKRMCGSTVPKSKSVN
jgi:hypothetical protein